MKQLSSNKTYLADLNRIARLSLPWEEMEGKTFLISGASGMIGSCMIDLLMLEKSNLNVNVIAVVRNEKRAEERFFSYLERAGFRLIKADITKNIPPLDCNIDYVLHAASNTHPKAYATEPIQTILANVVGTDHMLQCGLQHGMERFVFVSSVEIYGENRGDTDKFDEQYLGYLNCNTLRAGYPEGKRAGEALCQAYIHEKQVDIVIPRLPRVYGPTMLRTDTKAISQFIKKGSAGEDVVLKSNGTQLYSYCYVMDAISAILYCLLNGRSGEAYNVADSSSDVTLAGLAEMIAEHAGTNVVFDLPDDIEQAGYSTATKALLDNRKLMGLGWRAQFCMTEGLAHTMEILSDMNY